MGKGDRVCGARILSYAEQMRLSFPYTTFCLSYHSHPIRPCGAPSPRGEGYDARIPSSKQATKPPCEIIRSPVSSSRAQPRDLYCTAAICTHAPSLKRHLGASFSPFSHSRFTGLQEGFLHFGRDDKWKTGNLTSSFTPLRGSILRLWRDPSLRSYSYQVTCD